MSEKPVDKTSRNIANILTEHCFEWQATVYLSDESDEINHEQLMRCKRLIQKDNPDTYILSFISYSTNNETGEQQPYVCFYSWQNLVGTSVRQAQDLERFRVVGEQSRMPNRRLISRHLTIDQIEGTIRRIRKEKVYDLCMFFGDKKLRRYSFLNVKAKPSITNLGVIQKTYQTNKEAWYAKRAHKVKNV